jgi:hypothetical protein
MLDSESFTLDSALRPDELVRRLETDALDWQESRLSEPARTAGMYGFAFRRDGNDFRVRAQIANRGLYSPTYEGVVLPLDAGSRISGRFRFGRVALGLVGVWLAGAFTIIIFAMIAIAQAVATPGAFIAVAVAAGLIVVCAFWARFLLRYAWRSGELAREETRALLQRASATPTQSSRLTSRWSGPA